MMNFFFNAAISVMRIELLGGQVICWGIPKFIT